MERIDGDCHADSPRSFGFPALALQPDGSIAEAIGDHAVGERAVAEVLDRLAASRRDIHVYHSLLLEDDVADVDSAVLSGNLVVLIDAKRWRRADAVRATEHDWRGNAVIRLHHPGDPMQTGAWELRTSLMERRVALWRDSTGAEVRGAVVLTGSGSIAVRTAVGFAVLSLPNLERWLVAQIREANPMHLPPSPALHAALAGLLAVPQLDFGDAAEPQPQRAEAAATEEAPLSYALVDSEPRGMRMRRADPIAGMWIATAVLMAGAVVGGAWMAGLLGR